MSVNWNQIAKSATQAIDAYSASSSSGATSSTFASLFGDAEGNDVALMQTLGMFANVFSGEQSNIVASGDQNVANTLMNIARNSDRYASIASDFMSYFKNGDLGDFSALRETFKNFSGSSQGASATPSSMSDILNQVIKGDGNVFQNFGTMFKGTDGSVFKTSNISKSANIAAAGAVALQSATAVAGLVKDMRDGTVLQNPTIEKLFAEFEKTGVPKEIVEKALRRANHNPEAARMMLQDITPGGEYNGKKPKLGKSKRRRRRLRRQKKRLARLERRGKGNSKRAQRLQGRIEKTETEFPHLQGKSVSELSSEFKTLAKEHRRKIGKACAIAGVAVVGAAATFFTAGAAAPMVAGAISGLVVGAAAKGASHIIKKDEERLTQEQVEYLGAENPTQDPTPSNPIWDDFSRNDWPTYGSMMGQMHNWAPASWREGLQNFAWPGVSQAYQTPSWYETTPNFNPSNYFAFSTGFPQPALDAMLAQMQVLAKEIGTERQASSK